MENQEQLYYDENCPLCSWYSQKFVDAGMLPANGRCKFSAIEDKLAAGEADRNKVSNFIPLYLPQQGKTIYGVDALLYLIGKKSKTLEIIGYWKPVYWLANKAYKFISFNRRVIVPNYQPVENDVSEPDFNYKYRWAFIVFAFVASAIITWWFAGFFDSMWGVFTAIGLGWALFFLATVILEKDKDRITVLGHTSITMLRGVVIFGLSIPCLYVGGYLVFLIPFIILLAFTDMNIQMRKRMNLIGKGLKFYMLWLGLLVGTCLISLTIIVVKNIDLWMH